MVLNALQFARGQRPHLSRNVIVPRGERDHGTALDHQDLAVSDRFR